MEDPRPADPRNSFLSLSETAELVGTHQHVERELFSLTGRWSTQAAGQPALASVAGFFATQSALHAWRLGEWERRSPRSIEPPTGAGGTGWDEALAVAESGHCVGAKLACWVHVLAVQLAGRYAAHLARCGSAADPGTARWLDIARRDVLDGLTWGTALLVESCGSDHEAVAEVVAGCLDPLLGSGC